MTSRALATRGNLPAELTSFIGRRRHIQEVKAALTAARLVTLVGPGGVGKTRLALRSATDLRRGIADGVWLVELAGLQDAELVTKAVMTSLGLRDESSRWPVSRLIEYVAAKRLILVLDNCEHLLDASAVLADALLRLIEGGEEAVVTDAHLSVYAGLCRFSELDVAPADHSRTLASLDLLDLEADNIR